MVVGLTVLMTDATKKKNRPSHKEGRGCASDSASYGPIVLSHARFFFYRGYASNNSGGVF